MNRKALGLTLIFLVSLIAALGIFDAQAAPLQPPGNPVLSPPAGAHGVPVNSTVSITYDAAMDPFTVNTDTFCIYSMEHGYIAGVYAVNGGEIEFTPAASFGGGNLIETVATTQTLGINGEAPLQPTIWRFRTATSPSSGVLQNTGQLLGNTQSLDVTVGDLDGDGDLDAFVANSGQDYVWLNDGNGYFNDSGQRLGDEGKTSVDVDLGDLDGDGDLDAFVVVYSQDTYGLVWFNDGNGVFTDSGQNLGRVEGTAVNLGDLDGDGDLDAIYVTRSSARVLLNNGDGFFTDSGHILALIGGTDVALGDLDQDGDLDAFFANNTGDTNSAQQVYLNDGTGHFTNSGQVLGNMPANGVALGDLDGDGDLDAFLAITNPQGFTSAPNEVWLNDGIGIFSDSGQRLGTDSTNQVALGDIDGDGDLDAFFANMEQPNELWLNDGTGLFTKSRQFLETATNPSLELSDLDEDGSLDAFLTNFNQPDNVWLNLDQVYYNLLPFVSK
jgi:hypothetical protein